MKHPSKHVGHSHTQTKQHTRKPNLRIAHASAENSHSEAASIADSFFLESMAENAIDNTSNGETRRLRNGL